MVLAVRGEGLAGIVRVSHALFGVEGTGPGGGGGRGGGGGLWADATRRALETHGRKSEYEMGMRKRIRREGAIRAKAVIYGTVDPVLFLTRLFYDSRRIQGSLGLGAALKAGCPVVIRGVGLRRQAGRARPQESRTKKAICGSAHSNPRHHGQHSAAQPARQEADNRPTTREPTRVSRRLLLLTLQSFQPAKRGRETEETAHKRKHRAQAPSGRTQRQLTTQAPTEPSDADQLQRAPEANLACARKHLAIHHRCTQPNRHLGAANSSPTPSPDTAHRFDRTPIHAIATDEPPGTSHRGIDRGRSAKRPSKRSRPAPSRASPAPRSTPRGRPRIIMSSSTESLTHKWLRQNTQPYAHRDVVLAHVDAALARFPALRPKTDVYSSVSASPACPHTLTPASSVR